MRFCFALAILGVCQCVLLWVEVTISSSQRPNKEVAISSNRKCVRSGNLPPAPVFPRGQTRRFRVKATPKKERLGIRSTPRPLIFLMEVNMRYLLKDHAKALLDIGPEFRKPTENDIPTDEENLRTGSDVEFNSNEEIDPIQAEAEADGGDIIED
uniref:Uncharacterized protein n=1 Tax=Solanum tuberosum TaxID=4113 RepID=M1DHE4_SOLTU